MPTDIRYARSREAVFAAVCAVLVAEGMSGLTSDRLAQESGVSRSTIYRNWPDLAALTCEVFSELMHRESEPVSQDPAHALHEYLSDYARRLNDPTYCAVLIALIEGSARDVAFAAVRRSTFSHTRSRAAAIIRRGRAAGVFAAGLSVKQGVEDATAPFLYQRMIGQAPITARQVDDLHRRLLVQWTVD